MPGLTNSFKIKSSLIFKSLIFIDATDITLSPFDTSSPVVSVSRIAKLDLSSVT